MRKFLKFLSIAWCVTVLLSLTSCNSKRPNTAELVYKTITPIEIDSPSHISMRLRSQSGDAIYLAVPTFWDCVNKEWSVALQTPVTKKLLCATGKTSPELEVNFLNMMAIALDDSNINEEVISMFYHLEESQ